LPLIAGGKLMVGTSGGERGIRGFDATTRKKLKSVKVGASPQALALARNGKYGYVANAGDGTVSVLDVIRMAETARIAPPGLAEPNGLALLADGRSLFITSASRPEAFVVDAASGALRTRIDLGGNVSGAFAVNGGGDRVFLADMKGQRVIAVDLRAGKVVTTMPMAGGPSGVALARDDRTLLVTVVEPAALVVVPPNGAPPARVEVGRNPVAVAGHPYDDTAFVLSKGGGSLYAVDLVTRSAGKPVPVGLGPTGFAIARAGKTLYVTNAEADTVSVVDMGKRAVADTWEAGHRPGAIVFVS